MKAAIPNSNQSILFQYFLKLFEEEFHLSNLFEQKRKFEIFFNTILSSLGLIKNTASR